QLLKIDNLDLNVNYLSSNDLINRKHRGNTEFKSTYKSNRLNLKLAKKITFGTNSLQFLSEYNHDELINTSKIKSSGSSKTVYNANLYENRASIAGVFSFNDTLKSNTNISWKTYLGSRAEFLANGTKDVLISFGVESKIKNDNLIIIPYANYGKNVKYPTLFENAFLKDITDFERTDTTGTRLKPEYSNSAELGMNINYFPSNSFYEKLTAGVALFGSIYYNKLLSRPFDNLISESQIGRNNIKGIEGSLIFNRILNRFTISNSFTFLEISDAYLSSYKPETNYSVQFDYLIFKGFYFNVIYFYEGTSTAWFYDINNQFQTEVISSFYDLDLSFGYKFSLQDIQIHMQFSGYNILDNSEYRYYTLKKRFLQFALSFEY
ncbi:MAG: TonB-dependent receptor, partial [Calditrichia bacterium]|nr:TonB-dependent receptor [Calditrichia bacterium]